jgi:integrase
MTSRVDHRPLLSDKRIHTWYDENALRSKLTAEVNLRQLGLFCHVAKLDPRQLAQLARTEPERLHGGLVRYAKTLQEAGRLPSYIAKTFVGIKGWLRFNRADFDQFPRLRIVQGESIRDERVPTQEELRRVLSTYSARSRVVALFMAHTGVRPGVLATIDGSDGLRLGDLKDLTLGTEPNFERVPFHVVVPAKLSKTSIEYHTFGTAELADAVLAYLAERKARGEVLGPSSPVVTVDPMGAGTKLRESSRTGFITTPMMTRALRGGLKAILPSARTYVFRAYYSTQMVSARIDRDVREAILGHSLGISGRYNLSKKLHPSVIEELRREYAKAGSFLESGRPKEDRATVLEGVVAALLKEKGVKDDKVAEILKGTVERDELERILGSPKAAPAQSVVPAKEVPALLVQGWEFVSPLGADQAVLRAPRPTGPLLE